MLKKKFAASQASDMQATWTVPESAEASEAVHKAQLPGADRNCCMDWKQEQKAQEGQATID